MTAHAHEPSPHPSGHGGPGPAASRPAARRSRPRWLLPVVAAAAVAAMLVALDVISLSTVLYGGLLGSMVLMHVGGHGGHGGHGRPVDGGPHRGLEVGTADAADDPSGRSPGSETDDAASQTGSDPRATTVPEGNEKHDHDQHSSHACH